MIELNANCWVGRSYFCLVNEVQAGDLVGRHFIAVKGWEIAVAAAFER